MTFTLPDKPFFNNLLDQPVFWLDGAPFDARDEADVLLLVFHHTAGKDSREWLCGHPSANGVSATYIVGAYPDTGDKPRIYKTMSERTAAPRTQGFGSLGGLKYGPNRHAISVEVEGPPFRDDVLTAAAKLGASILKDWHDARKRSLLVVGHDHLDNFYRKDRHSDPSWDHVRFLQQVYGFVGGLQGTVAGWGR